MLGLFQIQPLKNPGNPHPLAATIRPKEWRLAAGCLGTVRHPNLPTRRKCWVRPATNWVCEPQVGIANPPTPASEAC